MGSPAPGADPARFLGQQRDSTKFDHFGARYYSMFRGRFASADPGHADADILRPQSWNAYVYGRNNPLRFTDPSGLQNDEPPIFRICCGQKPTVPPGMILPQQSCSPGGAVPLGGLLRASAGNCDDDEEQRGQGPGGGGSQPNPPGQGPGTPTTPRPPTAGRSQGAGPATQVSITTRNVFPTVCSWGGFGYGSIAGGVGVAQGESLALLEYDAEDGGAHGGLIAGGIGWRGWNANIGVESMRSWRTGAEHSGPIGLGGKEIKGASAVFGKSINTHNRDVGGIFMDEGGVTTAGAYFGLSFAAGRLGLHPGFGGGVYVSFSWSSC